MDSDLVGLRPLAGAGLSLSDCSDLPIHQLDCDKALSTEGRPRPAEGISCILSTIGLIRHSHLHTTGERKVVLLS